MRIWVIGLRARARDLGVVTSKLQKPEVIKAMQLAEGNFDCFGTAMEYCHQVEGLFRMDCLG